MSAPCTPRLSFCMDDEIPPSDLTLGAELGRGGLATVRHSSAKVPPLAVPISVVSLLRARLARLRASSRLTSVLEPAASRAADSTAFDRLGARRRLAGDGCCR